MNDTEGHVDILVCMAGTSAAAALHAAVQVGRRPENQGKNIVVIVPDNGMKYLSTPMYRQK